MCPAGLSILLGEFTELVDPEIGGCPNVSGKRRTGVEALSTIEVISWVTTGSEPKNGPVGTRIYNLSYCKIYT